MLDRVWRLFPVGVLVASLIGCGADSGSNTGAAGPAAPGPASDSTSMAEGTMADGAMVHGGHGGTPSAGLLPEERFGSALATVVGVNPEGAEITLDHEALDGIGMGAMTMAFSVAGDVDLGAVAPGDRIAVQVRQRKNYTYELVALCKSEDETVDCLQ